MPKPSPVRKHIRAALESMPTVASAEVLAKAAVDGMSDHERYAALLALLPRLIRDEDRRQAGRGGEAGDDPDAAWVSLTERRVRAGGEDLFLSDASCEQVTELAVIRERGAGNIAVSAQRFRSLAATMVRNAAETVAAIPAAEGLQALQRRLKVARRRVANRNALSRVRDLVDDLAESPDLEAARQALDAAQARLAAAAATARLHDEQMQQLREGLPGSLQPRVARAEARIR